MHRLVNLELSSLPKLLGDALVPSSFFVFYISMIWFCSNVQMSSAGWTFFWKLTRLITLMPPVPGKEDEMVLTFDWMSSGLPSWFPRTEVGKLTCGIVHPKTLANLDSLGKGPSRRCLIGKRVFYERDSFMEWFVSRVKVPEPKSIRIANHAARSRSAEVLGFLTDGFGTHLGNT